MSSEALHMGNMDGLVLSPRVVVVASALNPDCYNARTSAVEDALRTRNPRRRASPRKIRFLLARCSPTQTYGSRANGLHGKPSVFAKVNVGPRLVVWYMSINAGATDAKSCTPSPAGEMSLVGFLHAYRFAVTEVQLFDVINA